MREVKSVAEAPSLIEHDNSKILGLTINGKPICKGDYLPKQGILASFQFKNPRRLTTNVQRILFNT